MIYKETNRLHYNILPVIETENFIIINYKTYDKKTLALLNNNPLEAGFLGVANFNKFMALSRVSAVPIPTYHVSQNFNRIYNLVSDNNIFKSVLSVIDTNDRNIEWTIVGDTIIKYDIHKKTFETSRCQNAAGTKYYMPSPTFLYQDERYIYFAAHITTLDLNSSRYLYLWTLDKVTKILNAASYIDGGVANTNISQIYKRDDNHIYLHGNVYARDWYRIVQCGGGTFSVTTSTIDSTLVGPTSGTAAYAGRYLSMADEHGWIYGFTTNGNLMVFKINDNVVSEKQVEAFATTSKINFDKFKTIFPDLTDYSTYRTINQNSLGAIGPNGTTFYANNECMLMGDNNEYLAFVTFYQNMTPRAQTTARLNSRIYIFKRNNPEEDPLDLTLTDYFDYSMLDLTYGDYYWIKKNTQRQLYTAGNFGILMLNLDDEGKLNQRIYYDPNFAVAGFDSYGRIYATNLSDDNVEMFNLTVGDTIELEYENKDDSFTKFKGQKVLKNIIVTTKNMFHEPVSSSFELKLVGDAEFVETQSNTIKSKTGSDGKKIVQFRINGPGRVVVGKKIVYDHELSIVN